MNTNNNETSVVRFCGEASLQQASVSEMVISVVVCSLLLRSASESYSSLCLANQTNRAACLFAFIREQPPQNSSGRVGWEIKIL
jgi:hypothetical protein